MNDLNISSPDGQSEPSPAKTTLTLRQARENAGFQIGALAAILKVPAHRLESLEAGRFDELPDMTFARTLALSVCRALKVDPQPILAHFPASAEVRLGGIDRSLNAPMPQRSSLMWSEAKSFQIAGLSWPKVLAVLIVVAAAVFWFLLPGRDHVPNIAVPVQLPAESFAADEVTDASADPDAAQPGTVSAPAAETTEVLAAEAPLPADALNGLSLAARGASWVQVTGASGRVLLQRSLQAGETVVLSTDFPLSVVVGRADEVTVSLRGEPFGLGPHTRNNVARFEVR